MFGHGLLGFVVLGSVFLAVTGAEALYADMGHLGRTPIQTVWIFFVLPALSLNYLGQGALVLANPAAVDNPFFLLAPRWALLPLVILSTIATVIASQAVITGAFSFVRQASSSDCCHGCSFCTHPRPRKVESSSTHQSSALNRSCGAGACVQEFKFARLPPME